MAKKIQSMLYVFQGQSNKTMELILLHLLLKEHSIIVSFVFVNDRNLREYITYWEYINEVLYKFYNMNYVPYGYIWHNPLALTYSCQIVMICLLIKDLFNKYFLS